MGCIACTQKPEAVELEEYNYFHKKGCMPNPTNGCDIRYFDKIGENATFATGSFWRAQAYFSALPGVLRSLCGFSGGKHAISDKPNKIEDHIQVIDMEFDPNKTSYKELLEYFWKIHDPSTKPDDIRYSSRIFYHTKEQKRMAEESLMEKDREILKQKVSPDVHGRVFTSIHSAKHIFLAKAEDQQFYLQEDKYLSKLANCETAEQLAFSHLAAKLNAYCSGYASIDQFEAQLEEDKLDLDDMAIAYLREKIKRSSKLDTKTE